MDANDTVRMRDAERPLADVRGTVLVIVFPSWATYIGCVATVPPRLCAEVGAVSLMKPTKLRKPPVPPLCQSTWWAWPRKRRLTQPKH
jgi:hypothetical protein